MTQPEPAQTRHTACLLDACARNCTTECREAINRSWTALRGNVAPAQTRHTVDTITSDDLDQLYREIDTLRAVCRSNKQAYAGAVTDAMAADERAKEAEAALDAVLHPDLFDGTVNDMAELYAVHRAITDNGGQLTRPIHRALDALRTRWDLALRHEQQRNQRAALDAHTNPTAR